ncbi:MAG: hypothetical protein M3R43_13310, partial [Acidobacteriota bacterium]|nr:hypothetical protein [Acidobacteriota bacterium]
YVLVSVICIGTIITAAMEGISEQKFMPWFGFAVFTLFLFGQFILKSRRMWERKSFWLVTGLFFLGHMITFTKLLHAGRQVSGGEWMLLVLIEMAVLIIFRRSVYGA